MKTGMRGAMASLMIATLAASGAAMAQQPAATPAAHDAQDKSLNTERQKVSYALGLDVARAFQPIAGDIDMAALRKAVDNALAGGQPLISMEEAQATDAALRTAMAARSGQPVPGQAPGSAPPPVDKHKVGLMLGSYAIGPSLAGLKDEIDLDTLFGALTTVFSGGTPSMDPQQAQAVLQAFGSSRQAQQAERNRAAGAEFLAHNKTQKGVITTASGLQYLVLRQGSGERPTATSKVRVNYEGKLLDGTVFDSSYQRGEPAEFGLGQVIPGWTEGLQLMPVGAKYRFWIPSELAYGSKGTPGGPIGPDAALTFDVELLGVQ